MFKGRGFFAGMVLVALFTSAGCAKGSGDGDLGDGGGSPDDEVDGGLPPAADSAVPDHLAPIDADANQGFDAAPVDAAADGDSGGVSCDAPNTCSGAQNMAEVNGDDSARPPVTASGSTSQWFKVQVNEISNLSIPVKVTAVLTSPAGVDFDLYLYVDKTGDPTTRACTTVSGSSQNSTPTDSVSLSWDDVAAQDDTRIVSVEVRHKSGPCAADAKWSLTVTGNQ